jgi:hypothetical protein
MGLFIVGAVLVLVAVLPGASKLFGNETLNTARRLLRVGVGCVGIVLIVSALVIRGSIDNAPTKQSPDLVQLAAVALYSCHAPPDPSAPPDGASASKDQMLASKRETSKYNDDMNQYLDCLKTTAVNLETQYRGTATAGEIGDVDALAVRLNNDAVDRLQLKVKAFNGELAKYKARPPP